MRIARKAMVRLRAKRRKDRDCRVDVAVGERGGGDLERLVEYWRTRRAKVRSVRTCLWEECEG